MHKLILIIVLPLFSLLWTPAEDNLDKMLKEAQRLEQQRKYKSAAELAVKVQDLARKQKKDIIYIQALELEVKAQRWFSYEDFHMALERIDKAIENSFGRTEMLLRAFKISGYNQYYTRNSYQLRDNLNDGIVNDEPKLWSKHDIFKLIDAEAQAIIKNKSDQELVEEELEKLSFSKKIDGVQPKGVKALSILTAIYNVKNYDGDYPYKNPNLYAHQSKFVEIFMNYKLEHPAEIVAGYYAYLLANQTQNNLLTDHLNLKRISDLFILDEQYDKLQRYTNALEKFALKNSPIKTSTAVKLAEIYNGYAGRAKSNDKNTEARKWQKKALQICEEALSSHPNSYGAQSCKLLIDQIKNPELSLTLQTYLTNDKPIPVRIAYKNIKWAKLKLYRISASDFVKSQRHRGMLMQRELPLVWEEQIQLPQYVDFFHHSAITMLPKVEKGFYLLKAQTDKDIKGLQDDFEFLNVTDLAVVNSPDTDATIYQLVNRVSGENLNTGQAEIIRINYDYRTKQQAINYDLPQIMKDGSLSVERKTRGNYIQFAKDKDTLIVRFNYNVDYNRPDVERKGVQFFTDRAIYRPGQVVHFKAIYTTKKGDEYKPLASNKLQVNLLGADYKQIAARTLTTNEYGSVSGSFPIPESARPGNFRLRTQYGSSFFEVQYYKRPTFEAEFITTDKLMRPGEEVELDLHVKSFAGSSIQNADIETTVTIGGDYFRYWPGFGQKQVVDYRKDTTNKEGIAKITFKTLPGQESQFYTITSKVTLPDGASNEFSHSIYVVENPININISNWDNLWKENLNPDIKLSGNNGEDITHDVVLKVKLLDAPDDYFYEMPFSHAEKMLTSQKNWNESFPGMAYNDNLDPSKLKVDKTVLELKSANGEFSFEDELTLKEGVYAFEFYAADTLNQTIYKVLSDPNYRKINVPNPIMLQLSEDKLTPGETLKITLSSKFEDARIRLLVNDKNGILKQEIIEVDGKKQHIEIPVTQKSEGRISLSAVLVAAGRVFSTESIVEVVPVSRKIDIEFLSIRDQITPGNDETWSLQLKKADQPLKNAELVASMYDMSLDMFKQHKWIFPYQSTSLKRLSIQSSGFEIGSVKQSKDISKPYPQSFNWYLNSPFSEEQHYRPGRVPMIEGAKSVRKSSQVMEVAFEEESSSTDDEMINEDDKVEIEQKSEREEVVKQSIRTNFNETAFFYPTLKTDGEGKVDIKFSAPQSMTKWKFQIFAHDKEMASGYAKYEVVTQKKLMVIPNRLRFVHQGDKVELKALVYNLTEEEIQVHPDIKITNPYNGEMINASTKMRSISVEAKGNGSFTVEFTVPEGLNALTYQIAGKSGEHTDGEIHNIPVLPSRQRIINTLVLWNKPNETKQYKFASIDKLNSETAQNHELTIEMSTNPVWHAIKAMPAVFESNNHSAIQLARNYQITLWADYLIQKNPEIKRVFKVWKEAQPDALTSALKQKSELRNLLIGETPWEEVAANEELQHAALMEMLNPNFVQAQKSNAISKLKEQQQTNGAFSWRPGMRPSFYFTLQTVIQLSAAADLLGFKETAASSIMSNALNYLKSEIDNKYYKLLHYKSDTVQYVTPSSIMQYLLAQKVLNASYKVSTEAEKFYLSHAVMYKQMNLYQTALSGILALKYGNDNYAKLVVDRLKERATIDAEKGMFWRQNQYGWSWDEAPIETQSMIAQFLNNMELPESEQDAIKLWLVHEKQGQAWRNADASLAAVRTLITTGSDWVNEKNTVTLKLGGLTIDSEKEQKLAGTGYFSTKIDDIDKSMSSIVVENSGKAPVWGGIYHSFTESFENIESHTDELSVERQLFVKKQTEKGETVIPFNPEKDKLKVGDEVRVQLIIKSKRALDYVWVKAPHGACFEPKDQKSGYRWEKGKSLYMESHDSEKRFFFSNLNNESLVVGYDLYVERNGVFNAGPVEIQSAYAPEFSAHTAGLKINVEE